MEYNEAKKTLEDLGIDPEEVGKRGEKIVSEIMDKAKAMNQNESISHVSGISGTRIKHWNEETEEVEYGLMVSSTLNTYKVIPDFDLSREVRWDKMDCDIVM